MNKIISDYNVNRAILAMRCSEALGLKPIPQVLYEVIVRTSEIPRDNKECSQSYAENSLLTMGLVYTYGSTAKFIDQSGHTCIIPYNDVVMEELRKCGYVICEYGKPAPKFDPNGHEEFRYRKQATLPEYLAKKIARMENEQIEPVKEEYYNFNGAYDVFDEGLYTGHQFSHYVCEEVVKALGFESPVSRKFMAITGYGGPSLTELPESVDTLEEFVVYASMHPVLNTRNYFGENGLYDYLSKEFKPEEAGQSMNK